MKAFITSFFTLFILILLSCTQEKPDYEADIKALNDIRVEIMRVWNNNDYKGYMAFIDEEAIFFWQNGPVVEGYDAIAAAYKDFFNSFDSQSTIKPEEILVLGDYAYIRETWNGYLCPKGSTDTSFFSHNTNIAIFKKQTDNSWKVWRAIYNSNEVLEEK